MVSYVVDRLFDGSAAKLVLSALSSHKASAEELAEITSGGQRASVEQDAVRETINICNRAGVGLYPVDARGIPASQSPGESPGIQPFR